MGETRVDLLHLLEDLRDAYPGSLEETIIAETVANALDSGAGEVAFHADPAAAALVITDDGAGMTRAQLRRYHDLATSSKRRGEGIGFAGVGIKLGLLASEEVVTETRREAGGGEAGSALGPVELARRMRALAPGTVRRLGQVAAMSFVGGMLEAGLLVLLARIAVAVAEDTDGVQLISGQGPEMTVGHAILVALGLLLAKVATGAVIARGTASLATFALTRVRLTLLRSFLAASWRVQATERPGHLQELMTTHADRTTMVCMSLATFVTAGMNVLTLVLIAVVVDPLAALTIVVTGAALALAMRPLASAGRRISSRQAGAGRVFAGKVSELVSVARELHVFGTGSGALARVEELHHAQAREYRRSRTLMLMTPHVYQGAALLVLVAGIGLVSVTSSNVAGIGAVVLLLLRAFAYGQQTQSSFQVLNDMVPYLDKLRAQRDLYQEAPAVGGDRPVGSIGRLELDGVGYAYKAGRPVLHEVRAAVDPGQAIGIVGPSGSGKSTLLQVLLRLREPTSGRLLVDGVPASHLELESWWRKVAFVPQDPRLIEGTVAENIAFFRDVDREDIVAAARRAHLADEIEALPGGYDEMIGPEDTSLSGGQQQRLTIARALVGNPDLLVLDEPTSALDMRSEARIQQTLQELHGRVTMLVVAHRLSTVAACDRVMVLSDGAVQGFAGHEELLTTSTFYEDMARLALLPSASAGQGESDGP
jgi:ATP-binding cassette, subfamily B, bacterial